MLLASVLLLLCRLCRRNFCTFTIKVSLISRPHFMEPLPSLSTLTFIVGLRFCAVCFFTLLLLLLLKPEPLSFSVGSGFPFRYSHIFFRLPYLPFLPPFFSS